MPDLRRYHIYDPNGNKLADFPASPDFLLNTLDGGILSKRQGFPVFKVTAESISFVLTVAFKEFAYTVYKNYSIVKVS